MMALPVTSQKQRWSLPRPGSGLALARRGYGRLGLAQTGVGNFRFITAAFSAALSHHVSSREFFALSLLSVPHYFCKKQQRVNCTIEQPGMSDVELARYAAVEAVNGLVHDVAEYVVVHAPPATTPSPPFCLSSLLLLKPFPGQDLGGGRAQGRDGR